MKHHKSEALFTSTTLKPWLTAHLAEYSTILGNAFPYEVKYTDTDYLAFSRLEEHQLRYLHNVYYGTEDWKIPDEGRAKKKCDGVVFHKVTPYVIIAFPDFFCFIPIHKWEHEERYSVRRSLTADRAREIAVLVVKR